MKIRNKICTKCKKEYPATLEYFAHTKGRLDGLFSWCRACKKESDREYHRKNIKEINEQRREWRLNNKEVTKIRDKKYREHMRNRNPEYILVPKEKDCTRCKKTKPSVEFYKSSASKDRLTIFCKKCCSAMGRNGYKKHKVKRQEYGRQYNADNKEKIAVRAKRYYQNNKERIKKYKSKWHRKNRTKVSERCKEWGRNNKEHVRQYARNLRKNDLNYRILNNLRGRLYYALKSQGSKKLRHTIELTGCSMEELRTHIASKFLPGMSFINYGRGNRNWSIDHIRPCSSFNLSNLKQQEICFHYTNLRPLWNVDNAHKNSFYNGKYIRKNRKVN